MNNNSNTTLKTLGINELFKTMNLSDTFHTCDIASSWLDRHDKKFYGFVDGQYLKEEKLLTDLQTTLRSSDILDYFSSKALCQVYTPVDASLLKWAAESSTMGFKAWSDVSATEKSKTLNKIAENIEKHHELLSVVEALSTGKHLYKAKREITNLIESFKYYAGYVLKFEDKTLCETWHPTGPVCVIPDEYNNPSLTLNLRIGSLLASGNSVLLLPHAHCSLSAFILAELCSNQGLPDGVLNVIPIHPEKFKKPEELPILTKLIFTGSFKRSMLYSKLSAQANIHCDVLIPKRPVVIVYENADFHSAANGVLEAFFNHDTRSTSGGCKVLIQENIYDKFLKVLAERFRKSKFGSNFSQTDFSSIVTEEQENVLSLLKEKAVMFCGNCISQSNGSFDYRRMDPLLFSSIQTNCKLVQEELGGPIIVTVPFRTVKESISMFNCENKGSPVSIWTEVLRIALEVSQKLKSGVIWVNSENVMDPRFPISGVYLSGNSLEGGKDAIFSHMSILKEKFDMSQEDGIVFHKKDSDNTSLNEKKKPESESGVLTAVAKASAAQPSWEALTDPQKRKILTGIMEKLNKTKIDYIAEYQKVFGLPVEDCKKEFDTMLNVLYYWSMQNDKYNEPMKQITSDVMVIQNRDPLGVIGIQCPDAKPLLSFISLVVPAVMYGNAVVAISNMKYKSLISTMSEAFTAAKLPSGVINIVFGDASALVPSLRKNTDVNAVWYTDVPIQSIFYHSNPLQRLFCSEGIWNDLTEAKSLKYTLESTYTKSIFLPHGDIFAN